MHRTISDYKITKRKDGRYYVRIRDKGDVTHIYGKTKAEVKAKLEIKIEELNTLDRRRTEQSFPTRSITLANWAHLCLNTFCASSISGNTYIGYERYIRLHFGKLADTPISKITSFMVQQHINDLSRLGGKDGMSEAYLTRVKVFLHKENQGKRYDNDLRLQQPCKQIYIKNYGIEHTGGNPWL